MRTRLLTLGTAMALTIGLLMPSPAAANHAVTIEFTGGSEFYSPFNGPATITFTIDPTDVDVTFSLRLRPTGGTAIHTETAFVDNQDSDGTKVVSFDWPALSVNSPKTYEVAVYRNGSLVEIQSFFLRPRLVTITGATPNPFFPWIDDGYKDTTNVRFDLAAEAQAEARVFRPTSGGRCCGALVRTVDLGSLPAGDNTWAWDGRDGGGANLAERELLREDPGGRRVRDSGPFGTEEDRHRSHLPGYEDRVQACSVVSPRRPRHTADRGGQLSRLRVRRRASHHLPDREGERLLEMGALIGRADREGELRDRQSHQRLSEVDQELRSHEA